MVAGADARTEDEATFHWDGYIHTEKNPDFRKLAAAADTTCIQMSSMSLPLAHPAFRKDHHNLSPAAHAQSSPDSVSPGYSHCHSTDLSLVWSSPLHDH